MALQMRIRRLILPAVLLLLAVAFALIAHDVLSIFSTEEMMLDHEDREHIAEFLIWLASAFLVIRLVDIFILHGIVEQAMGSPPPRILSGLVALAIWILTLALALPIVFGQSTAGLLAASSVGLGVLGISLSRVIADVFYSVALVFERPFDIGDWVMTADGQEGQVKEVSWRTTTLVTINDTTIVIPNSKVGGDTLTNFNRPHVSFYRSLSFTLPFSVTAYRAERLLLSSIEEVPESASLPLKPFVSIKGLSNDGVEWALFFGVPDYATQWSIKTRIHRAILRNLFYADIDIAQRRMNVTMQRPQSGNLDEETGWLRRVALFEGLSDNERTWLAGQAREQLRFSGGADRATGRAGKFAVCGQGGRARCHDQG
jgi:small-conductance mechanosensitive channel